LLAPPEAAGPAAPQAATMGAAAAPMAAMPKDLSIVRRLKPPTWLTRDIVLSPPVLCGLYPACPAPKATLCRFYLDFIDWKVVV
jgi:hypothetical protein